MESYTRRNTCRVCNATTVTPFLDLGSMPPANSFLREAELQKPETSFPLTVSFCTSCTLVQTQDVVDASVLFEDYVYLTSASKTLVDHFEGLATSLRDRFQLTKDDLVVEIGSNDGVFLAAMKDCARVIGIEPASTAAAISRTKGIRTEEVFFTSTFAETLRAKEGPAKLMLATNVFAHIDDIHDVCAGIEKLLDDSGVFITESHWVGNLIGDGGFDQIYHEHLCYYSLHALQKLFAQFNMRIIDVEKIPIHGESIRVYAGKTAQVAPRVQEFLDEEKRLGLDSLTAYTAFAARVAENKKEITTTISQLKNDGKRIAGYAAPAKGNTLLNYCGLTATDIEYLSDTTPLKQGLFAPGSHIPVVAPGSRPHPDYYLLLAWNYAAFILKKEADFRATGGKFILPVPRVVIE